MITPTPTPAVTFSNQTLIPSLPNDISVQILARVPRSDHPSLSLVSKAFHSLISSPFFFTTRSLINSTETSLFIILFTYKNGPCNRHLFTLRRGRLVPLSPIPSCSDVGSADATLGPYIYVLGGLRGDSASTDVWIFYCRFNKWAAGPSMHVARQFPMVGVVDGKLYVIGGCEDGIPAEVYDPDRGTWQVVEGSVEMGMEEMTVYYASAVIGGKIYATSSSGLVAYDVGTRVLDYVDDIEGTQCCCMINGVLYWYDLFKTMNGFDLEEGHWKEVRGVEGDMRSVDENMETVNFEGKFVIFWDKRKDAEGREVQCMEIDVKKDENGELRGNFCSDKSVWSYPEQLEKLIFCVLQSSSLKALPRCLQCKPLKCDECNQSHRWRVLYV